MKKFCIFVSIIFVSLFTGCGKDKGITGTSTELTIEATTTESDVVVEIDDTTEEVTVVVQEEEKPAVVPGEAHVVATSTGNTKPATTEATGNVKPATTEATTEAPQTAKPATTEAPAQPTKPEKPATTEAPQHVHNYSKWVVDQAAYDETVVVKEAYTETVEHPAETHTQNGVSCSYCGQWFATSTECNAHLAAQADDYHFVAGWYRDPRTVVDKDAWTETINHPAETKIVHHDEVGHWECSCGARK